MQFEDIAKIFADWEEKKEFEWEFKIDENTYREKKGGLFKQSLPVVTKPVEYHGNGEEVFVISDLHIASGRNEAGVFQGTENFFADEPFSRFIDYIQGLKKTSTALLVINGDVFDFLRVTDYPGKVRKTSASKKIKNFLKGHQPIVHYKPTVAEVDDEFELWCAELKKIGIKNCSVEYLKQSISKTEKTYGLETDAYKAIYKLIKIKKGHPLFFASLAKWLINGNRILILKGNHDLEVYWDEVRNYIRLQLAQSIADALEEVELKEILEQKVFPRIKFIDDSVVIDNYFYLEHGHRYDKYTMILDKATLKTNPSQINMPFGSFFNRYVVNRFELYYPYLDKVRPSGNIVPMLIRDNFPLALKVIFQQVPFAIRVLSTTGRYIWFMLNRVFWFFLALFIPVIIIIISRWNWIYALIFLPQPSNVKSIFAQFIAQSGKGVALLVASYFLARIVGWFQLTEPDSLARYAKGRLQGSGYRVMTMGHTHNPGEYVFDKDQRFYNTGTWIPVIETSNASVRDGFSYTYLHMERDLNNQLQPANGGLLQRWNDDAGRSDPQLLILSK